MAPTRSPDELSLEGLARRLEQLENERAIIRTLHLYGQMIDQGLDRDWAGLFIEDGVFLCRDLKGETIIHEQGRDALAAWVRVFKAGETRKMKHLVISPVVTLDGDNARVISQYANMTEHRDPSQPPHVRFMGRYIDDMVRCADGEWRFRQRVSETEAPLLA